MSMFMPESGASATPTAGTTEFSPGTPAPTAEDVALMQRMFNAAAMNPTMIPESLLAYFLDWIQSNRLIIPIGQVFGFAQFAAQPAPFIFTAESRTSSGYGDLATPGPTISGLPDGEYLFVYGSAAMVASAGPGKEADMSIQVNADAVDPNDACISSTSSFVSIGTARTKVLADGGSNTVTAKYASLDNTTAATFARRWMIALRYANH